MSVKGSFYFEVHKSASIHHENSSQGVINKGLLKKSDAFVYTLKTAGLFQPKFGSNMDKPKCWVKNVHFQL